MPILPAEPSLFPPDFWEATPRTGAGGKDARWWCLHTKPRQEKSTARYLYARRIAHYLPQVVQEKRTPGGRKITSILPLFPGYMFLHADERTRLEAFRGNTLVQALDVVDQEGLDRDLRQIHRMLASGLTVVPEPVHPIGTRVRILAGPLQGLVGIVTRRGKSHRFVATVRFLEQGAAVELQDWQVERLD